MDGLSRLIHEAMIDGDLLEARRPAWMQRAACKESHEEFFIERGQDARPARAVCAGCPVRCECLQYALDERIKFGIWGGLSERERRQLRRRPLAA